MRMRYSRTKPLRRNAPSQSTNLKLCRFATLGDGKTCTPRVQNITETAITKLFGLSWTPFKQPNVDSTARTPSTALRALRVSRTLPKRQLLGLSWTPFKQPSRHQRRLDCRTRTPSTALRTRQLRVGKPAFLWETQCKNQCCGFVMVFSACQFARCISYSCCSHPTL